MNRPASFHQRGISLLEVMISIIILAVAGSILVLNSHTSTAGQERSKVYGEASTATKEVLETLHRLSLDSISRIQDQAMPHSQGSNIQVRVSVRALQAGDVGDLAQYDTSTLRHVTMRTSFQNLAGARVTKIFQTVLYKP